MAAPSYLSTFLLAHQLRGAQAFAERFAGEWLVWEPGPWQAPPRGEKATLKIDASAKAPQHGNALCFHLGPPNGRTLSLGRDPSSDVLITDGTVSRHHAALIGEKGVWSARALAGRESSLNGHVLIDVAQPLAPGASLVLGGVALTFHDTASLMKRLIQSA